MAEETVQGSEKPQESSARVSSIPDFPVVSIGASAGGVQALQMFFEALPADSGAAYVVILHLDPEYPSQLASILERQTGMPVIQVKDKALLEVNHVYVIPPDRSLLVRDGELETARFTEPRGHRAPIDQFFRSIASRYGDGFAIILSGSGSDGALGIKSIKEHGGLVLVQDPEEASFSAMPRQAISTGAADIILPVAKLAQRLMELIKNKRLLNQHWGIGGKDIPEQLTESTEDALRRIIAHLHDNTGHNFAKYKRSTILRRIGRRMQVHRLRELSAYLQFLRDNVEECQALFDELLISVTLFFRDPPVWEVLQKRVLSNLIKHTDPNQVIRVWVPGCATGEEAYSIAILLLELLERVEQRPEIQIFASDLDEGVLAKGREGRYPVAIQADVSSERLTRFFTREDDSYCVSKEVRDCVLFAQHSLLRDPPFSRINFISCRNLLIYLNRELQEQVFGILHYSLNPGGYLLLGSSENAQGDYFRVLEKRANIFQARKLSGLDLPHIPDLLLNPRTDHWPSTPKKPRPDARQYSQQHKNMLEKMSPPSILVDDNYNVLHLSDSAGRFLVLPGGVPSRNVVEMVRPELQFELRAALHSVIRQRENRFCPFQTVRFNGTPQQVAMVVQPRTSVKEDKEDKEAESLALILFIEAGSTTALVHESENNDETIQQLHNELQQANARLRTSHEEYSASSEELRATNEELQSINEEHRSTAEELETSKEELQSINEELETVNSELKHKLHEVSQAHSDMENLLVATEIATLFLDRRLRINRFTPQVTDLINIKASDIGRPLSDLTHKMDWPSLPAETQRVLRDLVVIDHETQSDQGNWYLARIRPYRTMDDRIDGVIITFVDITERKQAVANKLQLENALDDELAAMTHLHQFSTSFMGLAKIQPLLEELLNIALTLHRAQYGIVFRTYEGTEKPECVAARGFDDDLLQQLTMADSKLMILAEDSLEHKQHRVIADIVEDAPEMQVLANNIGIKAIHLTPLMSRAKKPLGLLITFYSNPMSERTQRLTDLYVRHAAEIIDHHNVHASLQKTSEDLRLANQYKDRFLATLSHELRNPLAAIKNYVEALHHKLPQDDELAISYQVLRHQVNHLGALLTDLIDIGQISRGQISLNLKAVAVGEVFKDAVATAKMLFPNGDHVVKIKDISPPGLKVQADPRRLEQIIINLVSNAAKHNLDGCTINLDAKRIDNMVEISVHDDGQGLVDLNEIFEPFITGSGKNRESLGMGLTVVRELALLHGGTAWAESSGKGKGADFYVTIPVADAESEKPMESTVASTEPPAAKTTGIIDVLVVDDDNANTDSLQLLLQTKKCRVQIAHDSVGALQSLGKRIPHLVFLDVGLPGMNGVELAKTLRENSDFSSCYLVILSGYAQGQLNVDKVNSEWFDRYVIKPMGERELAEILQEVRKRNHADLRR